MTPKGGRNRAQVKHARAPQVRVVVTQKEINESVQKDSGHCMLAEALKVAVPTASAVSVDLQTIRFSDRSLRRRYVYLTPRVAQVALVDFDQGRKPEPFTITLRGGAVSRMEGAAGKSGRNGAKPPGKRRTMVRGKDGTVPDVVGGRTPPVGALASNPHAGRRREFGLRGLGR